MAKTKIPKRIAGVKLPKELRKAGNALIEQAQSPEGRAMIGKGISAVAALALAARAQPAHAPAPVAPTEPAAEAAKTDLPKTDLPKTGALQGDTPKTEAPKAEATKVGNGAAPCPDPVGDAIGAAATMLMGRLFGTKSV